VELERITNSFVRNNIFHQCPLRPGHRKKPTETVKARNQQVRCACLRFSFDMSVISRQFDEKDFI